MNVVARFILALWVEMPPDKSGNFARNDTPLSVVARHKILRLRFGTGSATSVGGNGIAAHLSGARNDISDVGGDKPRPYE